MKLMQSKSGGEKQAGGEHRKGNSSGNRAGLTKVMQGREWRGKGGWGGGQAMQNPENE